MKIEIKYQNDNIEYKFNLFENINDYDKVIYINCSYNYHQLTLLPELPNSLKYLYCINNKFIKNIKYKYLKQFNL